MDLALAPPLTHVWVFISKLMIASAALPLLVFVRSAPLSVLLGIILAAPCLTMVRSLLLLNESSGLLVVHVRPTCPTQPPVELSAREVATAHGALAVPIATALAIMATIVTTLVNIITTTGATVSSTSITPSMTISTATGAIENRLSHRGELRHKEYNAKATQAGNN